MNQRQYHTLLKIICSTILFVLGIVFLFFYPSLTAIYLLLFILSALLVGFEVLINAVNSIIHGHILDENFLMAIGSICAFVLGEYAEGTVILLLYQVGELFQSIAVGKSRNSIAELMNIYPDKARLDNGQIVDPFDINIGDIIIVEPGEKIALDGIVVSGSSSVDTSSLTGEHVPKTFNIGDEIFNGTVNLTSPLKIRVTKEFSESTVSKILELVENASTKKATIENFVTRFAKYYTPIVVMLAFLLATVPTLLFSANLKTWLLRAVMFIVISCPCALVVSVPLSFFSALGTASKIGILIKGSNYLELLGMVDTVIFDKTGTITKGSFKITEICPSADSNVEELLYAAALCEQHSTHPIANAIRTHYGEIDVNENAEWEVIAGKGIIVRDNEKMYLTGNSKLLNDFGYKLPDIQTDSTVVHISCDRYLGYIVFGDEVKESALLTIKSLKELGIKNIVMLSGDSEDAVKSTADSLGFDKYHSNLMPTDKVNIAEDIIRSSNSKVAFVGDGVNDAPVLARCDVGIAMGALGSDAAIEAADIVIMNDDLLLLPKAIKISKKAIKVCKQNIVFSLIIKFSQLILSILGLSNIWLAIFADVGVLIIAIINSMRNLSFK